MNQQCRVCDEPAAGFHFGAFTCEGCKVRKEIRLSDDRILAGNETARWKSGLRLAYAYYDPRDATDAGNSHDVFLVIRSVHCRVARYVTFVMQILHALKSNASVITKSSVAVPSRLQVILSLHFAKS